MTAGYSGTPLAKKLGLKPGMRAAAPGAPAHYPGLLAPLPEGFSFLARAGQGMDFLHFFTTSRTGLEKAAPGLKAKLAPAGMLWVSWPKKASKVATDMTGDAVRDVCLPIGLVDVKVCAVDDVWSGLKLVIRKELR